MMKNVLILLLTLFSARLARATTYYVSARGDDAQAGTSPATAWRSVARASAQTYSPGDRLLLEGGQTFAGSLTLRGSGQGSAAQPIVISSYGPGRATIASGTAAGFYAYNLAGIELRRLAFAGAGRLLSASAGVVFYLDQAHTTLRYLRLDSLDVSGYRDTGISIGSWAGASGYADVRLTHCQAHANGAGGIDSYAEALKAHQDWYVGRCQAYDNAGRADVTDIHTGSGIVLGGVDGALIERCEAYNNGWLNAWANGGPVGIWGYACNRLVIQSCESHHNRSGLLHDGGGFDLDGGCTNSVLQYNYSHDNDGPGYLLAQYPGADPMHDLTIRYNVSENDARRYDQGAIQVWSSGDNGGIQRAAIYHNTVLLSPPANGSRPQAVRVSSAGISGISLRNNVLQTSGGLALLASATTEGLRLEGNCYWSSGAPLVLDWAGTTYADLPAWRAATGQEQLPGGRATGLWADPQLRPVRPPQQVLQLDAATLPAPPYAPLATSPVRGAALDLLAEFSLNPGPRDLLGNPTPSAHANLGALEEPAGPVQIVTATTAAASQRPGLQVAPNPASTGTAVLLRGATRGAQVQLLNVRGQLVATASVGADGTIRLPVAGLAAGLYVVRCGPESTRLVLAE